MENVTSFFRSTIADPGQRYVFPSEVAADFWSRAVLERCGIEAVARDRFLSWDEFKEGFAGTDRPEKPANILFRTICCADMIRENAESPFLSSIIRPEFASSAEQFVPYLRRILPSLGLFSGVPPTRDDALIADCRELYRRYSGLLARSGYFEPAYLRPDFASLDGRYAIIFPEVIEDFNEYRELLAGKPGIDLISAPPAVRTEPLLSFDNSLDEIRGVLSRVGSLIDSGESDLGDIVLTIPGLDGYRRYLADEARLLAIPLDFRQGGPASSYGAGRFYQLIADVVDDYFSFETMKALLLNRLVPWKNEKAFRALIRFGSEKHCVRNYKRRGKTVDVWDLSLEGNSLLAVYRDLRGYLNGIASSPSFSELKRRLVVFTGKYLDRPRWGEEEDRVVEFCMDVLENLVRAEADLPDLSVPSPFRLFLSVLKEKNYVRRSAEPGIPVYDYRVSAGIEPAHHFIMNASQDRTAVFFSSLPFLRDDQKETLKRPDVDATGTFMNLYRQSGSSVRFSFARESFSGYQVPPGGFDPMTGIEAASGPEWSDRPLRTERRFWLGSGPAPSSLGPVQRSGFLAASATLLEPKGLDYAKDRAEETEVAAAILAKTRSDSGFVRVTATWLEEFAECPLAFFLTRILRLEEEKNAIEFLDDRAIGNLYHRIVALLFERIAAEDGVFRADREGDYRLILGECIETASAELEASDGAFLRPVLAAFALRVERFLETFLAAERGRFSGYAVAGIERTESWEGNGIRYEGRMDRLSSRLDTDGTSAYTIFDYKKGRLDDLKARMKAPEKRGAAYQFPLYSFLLEKNGKPVEAAFYYSFEKSGFQCVFSPREEGWIGREDFDAQVASLGTAVGNFASMVRSGRFPALGVRTGACASCRVADACRARFVIR
jgi:hypothetical protein